MSEHLAPNYVRSFVTPEVKAVNAEEREVMHLISTGSVDRAGDVVEPAGAQIDNFLKNPVVLVDHDYRIESIIGKAVRVEVGEKGLWARTKFLDTPLGQDAFKLAEAGIGGWSIGFRPVKHESIEDDKGRFKGFRFKEWELLEYSAVAIPMNQDVVNNAVKRGLVHAENVSVFFRSSVQEPSTEAPVKAKAPEATPDFYNLLGSLEAASKRLERNEAGQELARKLREQGV